MCQCSTRQIIIMLTKWLLFKLITRKKRTALWKKFSQWFISLPWYKNIKTWVDFPENHLRHPFSFNLCFGGEILFEVSKFIYLFLFIWGTFFWKEEKQICSDFMPNSIQINIAMIKINSVSHKVLASFIKWWLRLGALYRFHLFLPKGCFYLH